MWKIFVACSLAVVTAFAQDNSDKTDVHAEGRGPQFRAQVGQRLSTNEDSLRLFVAVSVPYDNLIFLLSDTGFAATFELVTTVFRDGDGLVAERIDNIRVESLMY